MPGDAFRVDGLTTVARGWAEIPPKVSRCATHFGGGESPAAASQWHSLWRAASRIPRRLADAPPGAEQLLPRLHPWLLRLPADDPHRPQGGCGTDDSEAYVEAGAGERRFDHAF